MLGIGTGSWLPPASAYIRKNSVIKPSGFTSKWSSPKTPQQPELYCNILHIEGHAPTFLWFKPWGTILKFFSLPHLRRLEPYSPITYFLWNCFTNDSSVHM